MHWHEVRGHVLTTTGARLEDMDIGDFLDVCYAYSINSPDMRADIRSAMLGYMFAFEEQETEAEATFEGFKKAALSSSMLDELDAFNK